MLFVGGTVVGHQGRIEFTTAVVAVVGHIVTVLRLRGDLIRQREA